jgi:uncharacterized protein
MNIVIFGATSMLGKQLVQQALFDGHAVTAFGRNVFTTDFLKNENLHLIQGALFDATEVYEAIKNKDAVIAALEGASDGADKTRTTGLKNIVLQMEKANVKRIITLGGSGILNTSDNIFLVDVEDYPPQFFAVAKQYQQAYEYLTASTLNWTMVCPTKIIDAAPVGIFYTNANYEPVENKNEIKSGDLALFMLKELQKNEFSKCRVGISN